MSSYESYLAALALVADEPGERERHSLTIEAERVSARAPVSARDREIQEQWARASRRLRDLEVRLRRLATDASVISPPPSASPPANWSIAQVDAELTTIESGSAKVEAAVEWVIRTRAQVFQERARIARNS